MTDQAKISGESALGRSWLVQRLQRPFQTASVLGRDNPFAFGGGRHNGGLSPDAMDLLREVWRFDYMGAAEFEWGAVPEALKRVAKMAEDNRLVAYAFSWPLHEVEQDWRDKSRKRVEGDATVYVICDVAWTADVEARIRAWAAKNRDYESGVQLKERTNLCRALRPMQEWDRETCGWLELDNGFLFFTDEAMWKATADLFGVAAQSGRTTP